MSDESSNLETLCELSNAIGGAAQSPWQPRCIAEAFATPLPRTRQLTLQQWIDLDAIHSPYLLGQIPQDVDAFLAAASALGLAVTEHTSPADLAALQGVILDACSRAFATTLQMGGKADADGPGDDGFGEWLPIYACLVVECGIDPERALEMRVDRAFALIAGLRHNQGLKAAGVPYAVRDLTSETEPEDGTDG